GSRIGPYEVLAAIGAGGMGEVYRARDIKLNRDVAIKVLPSAVAGDADRLARFHREAQLLATLNHPNIAHIHGLEDSTGIPALVMELVDGETLADSVAGGLPVGKALAIAREIAQALEAAHAANVVHRDLKPANVKIRQDGAVKVLDFGLAKALDPAVPPSGLSQAETMTSPAMMTQAGVILGTAAYMSPEQARGKPADKRSDIWSFGCVLYEMLTGRAAFGADSVPESLGRILEREPDWSALPGATPDRARRLLRRCLQKDPAQRLHDIADARLELEELLAPRSYPRLTVGARTLVGAALALVLGAAAVLGGVAWFQSPRQQPADRSQWVQLTNLDSATQPALSPDGRMLAFVRGAGTFTTSGQIYIKLLPSGEPTPLTQDAFQKMSPVFAPDSARIAYTVNGAGDTWDTWAVPTLRGEARPWLRNASGLTWIGPSQVLFSEIKTGSHMGLVTSFENRADPRELYFPRLPVAGMAHRSYRSPDGAAVLAAEMDDRSLWLPCRLIPFDGSSSGRTVGPPRSRCTSAAWSPDGAWMYFSADAGDGFHLWRQRFPDGIPEQLTSGPTEEEGVAIAPDGESLITSVGLQQRAVWFHDASGKERQISLEGYAFWPLLSADGTKVYYRVTQGVGSGQSPSELWVTDVGSGRSDRILPGQLVTGYDISPDDQIVAAVVEPAGRTSLWLAWLDGRAPPRRIPGAEGDNPRFGVGEIIFRSLENGSWVVTGIGQDGTGQRRIEPASGSTVWGTVSPDGRWLSQGGGANGLHAASVLGDPLVPVLATSQSARLRWGADMTHVYLSLQFGEASAFAVGRTYILPVSPGSTLPRVPAGGFQSEVEIAAVPGSKVVELGDFAPGPSPDVYAFSRTTGTRNLYRIPLQ
ncbi:MAG TPA: protein kinase, partial [Vicinamibacterales bacterium]|nr:protein kinase [Vicinamibacterales bacterium]